MYVKSVEEKVLAALQANPEILHAELLDGLSHLERIGLLDTVREMERNGMLKRDLTTRDARGHLVLRYVRKA